MWQILPQLGLYLKELRKTWKNFSSRFINMTQMSVNPLFRKLTIILREIRVEKWLAISCEWVLERRLNPWPISYPKKCHPEWWRIRSWGLNQLRLFSAERPNEALGGKKDTSRNSIFYKVGWIRASSLDRIWLAARISKWVIPKWNSLILVRINYQ